MIFFFASLSYSSSLQSCDVPVNYYQVVRLIKLNGNLVEPLPFPSPPPPAPPVLILSLEILFKKSIKKIIRLTFLICIYFSLFQQKQQQ